MWDSEFDMEKAGTGMRIRPGSWRDEVVRYYDECEVDYRIVWHLKKHLSLHYGYWDPETKSLREALRLMNVRLAELAGVGPGSVVLDAGCGVGGSAIFLAETYGCRVDGITLSARQVESARRNAAGRGVDRLTQFVQGDFCQTEFDSDRYDIVWAVESVCHAEDKSAFLREAARLLREGGRLVVADFFERTGATGSSYYPLMRKWLDSWAIPALSTPGDLSSAASSMGYHEVSVRDISDHISPTVRRLQQTFIPGLVCSSALHLVGRRSARQWANTWSTYYQYKAFKHGLWRYHVVTATR